MEAFAIRNKATGEYWAGKGGRAVWTTQGAAKSAWVTTFCNRGGKREPFNNQTKYEIVRFVPEERPEN